MQKWVIVLLVVLSLILCTSCGDVRNKGKAMSGKNVRESVIAGSWYPDNPEKLTKDIKGYLKQVPEHTIEGELIALISPHAGYMYSGQVAAYAYKLLEGKKYDIVVIVANVISARRSPIRIFEDDFFVAFQVVPV